MKKIVSLIAVVTFVCFTSMAFAADAAKAPAPAAKPGVVKVETAKPAPAQAPATAQNIITGKIVKIDKAKNEIVVKEKKVQKTVIVTPEEIGKLKKGEKVKIELGPDGKAVKIEPVKK
jgi:hypothetical protein